METKQDKRKLFKLIFRQRFLIVDEEYLEAMRKGEYQSIWKEVEKIEDFDIQEVKDAGKKQSN